jgi:hypothetical protein
MGRRLAFSPGEGWSMAVDPLSLPFETRLAATGTDRSGRPAVICRLCVDMLGVTGAGISMVTTTGNRGVVCATNTTSARIEDLQFTLGEGPCFDAVSSSAPILVPDLDDTRDVLVDRWPAFMEGAAAAGVRAVFAFPLRIGAIRVGALDLYRSSPGNLAAAELSGALVAADAAALSLLELDTGREDAFADDLATRSTYALEVHQATGMVTVQAAVSIDVAFLLLRACAFASGRSLAAVARDVVERRIRFPQEEI